MLPSLDVISGGTSGGHGRGAAEAMVAQPVEIRRITGAYLISGYGSHRPAGEVQVPSFQNRLKTYS